MVPNIEKDYILLLGIVFYIRNILLLGSTTKKCYSEGFFERDLDGARKDGVRRLQGGFQRFLFFFASGQSFGLGLRI